MVPGRALAVAALSGALASCSLITSFDGLGSGAGGADTTGTTAMSSATGLGAAGGAGANGGSGAGGAMDAGMGGDAMDASSDAGLCVPGGTYCGGDKVMGDPDSLYLCKASGAATFVEHCTYGCTINPPGQDDMCQCQPGGSYCGGDKIDGNPNTLYRCNTDGSGTVIKHCPNGCTVVPGSDDKCA